jgi:MFS family permease
VWEKSVQGHILGAFFYGYLVSQVPMGMLAGRIGGKWVMVGCLGVSTLGMLLSPMAARIHWVALVVIRVLVGVGSVRL